MSDGIVVVGGGLAAQRFCETLRTRGYDGRIRVACDEHAPPYDRPPLSKEFLRGDVGEADLALRPHQWYDEAQVDLLLGHRAVGLDLQARRLRFANGTDLGYERLLIATGSEPRRLPMAEGFSNVHYLRTVQDAAALRDVLRPGTRLTIVGAGFIGQEVAATARGLGVEVTLIEALAAPLERIVGPQLGRWFASLHRDEGVDVRLGATITAFHGDAGVEELVLDNREAVPCDVVVIGIGVAPATRWLADSGLPTDGIPVDEAGATEAWFVYAAGDAARPLDPHTGAHVRTEHWEAAARQGSAAALGILGLPLRRLDLPSFWSDQYGLRIQYLGRSEGADRIAIHGDPEARDFAAVFQRGAVPVAALLVGRPRALPQMRRLIAQQGTPVLGRAERTDGGQINGRDEDALRAAS